MTSRSYALVLAVALAASAGSLANGFVYDDVRVIQQDPRVHSLHRLPELLEGSYWGQDYKDRDYRPVTSASFALDWAFGGGRAVVFHVTNVLLQLVVVALVLALATRVLGPGGALVAALWFAVQPIHVEAVANVVGRAELLAAVGYLAAVLAYAADGESAGAGPPRGARRAALALGVLGGAVIAYGAKEHALTLPVMLLLVDLWGAWRAGAPPLSRFRRHVLLFAAVAVLAAGYLAARAHAVGGAFAAGVVAAGLEGQSLWGRALVMAPAVLVWLRWMIFPLHLSADYLPDAFVPRSSLGLGQVAGFAAVGGLLLAAWLARRRAPGVTAGIVWGIVTVAVATNLVIPTGVLLAERLAYLPSVGAAIAVGALWERLPAGRLTWPVTALILGLLAARTVARIPVWHDQQRFLAALVEDAPDSYRTHWALGAEAFKHGEFGTGEREMLAAMRIYPGEPAVPQELGERYLEAGFFDPAARFLKASYRLDPRRTDAALRAVFALLKAGRPDSAAALGAEALRGSPDTPGLLILTGEAYAVSGRPRRALALARRLVFSAPRVWSYQQMAATAAARAGRCDEARERLERAVALAPAAPRPRALLRKLGRGAGCGLVREPS
jgi:Flp pilus assembly protein TadD